MGKLNGMRKRDLYIAEYAVGKTYREIAKEYGVSFQAVQQAVTRPASKVCCVWPELACWMEESNVTVADLAEKLGVHWNTLCGWMIGKHEP